MLNILVLGNCIGETLQHTNVLRNLGHNVEHIRDSEPGYYDKNFRFSFSYRVFNRLGFTLDKYKVNKHTLDFIKQTDKLDIIWVEKCKVFNKQTLMAVKNKFPNCIALFYGGDDMMARYNQSFYFKKVLPHYDICFSTKSFNCKQQELPTLGAKNCTFVYKSVDTNIFNKIELTKEDTEKYIADVCFVGAYEYERASFIEYLVANAITVKVYGRGWSKLVDKYKNLIVSNQPLVTTEYVKAINASKINLGFLRKINRDLHTNRSVEIPACGAFMLAENSSEHQQMLKQGIEADFFDTKQELLQKVKYYLANPDQLENIRANARAVVINNFSDASAMQNMIKIAYAKTKKNIWLN